MKKTTSVKKKRSVSQKTSVKSRAVKASRFHQLRKIRTSLDTYLSRRPHRSFRRTRRRDYVRSLELPGYIAFTAEVFAVIKTYKKTFLLLILSFSVATALLSGVASQESYRQLSDVLDETSKNVLTGTWGEVGKAGLLLTTALNGTFRSDMTEVQQVYAFLLVLFTWLTTVWFLRNALASRNTPKLRTAIYNAGAPIVPTALIAVVLLLQLIPAAIGIIAYTTAISTGFLSNPLLSIVFSFVVLGLLLLTVYLIISSFFALIVVTLPGMYPWQAIRTAGDMVVGRRLKILLRVFWLFVVTAILVIVIMLPLIIGVNWLQSTITRLAGIPIIPLILIVVSTSATVFISSYIYLLYRKVLDDDAAPA